MKISSQCTTSASPHSSILQIRSFHSCIRPVRHEIKLNSFHSSVHVSASHSELHVPLQNQTRAFTITTNRMSFSNADTGSKNADP